MTAPDKRAGSAEATTRDVAAAMWNAADEIDRLREALRGATVIANAAGATIRERDAEITSLRAKLAMADAALGNGIVCAEMAAIFAPESEPGARDWPAEFEKRKAAMIAAREALRHLALESGS